MQVYTTLIRYANIRTTMAVVRNGDKRTLLSHCKGRDTIRDIVRVKQLKDLETLGWR